jgi:hypothetical protein
MRLGYKPTYDKPTARALEKATADSPQTNSPDWNLLPEEGCRIMWAAGWDYHGGVSWRRSSAGSGGDSDTDAHTRRRLPQDYQAHHVIPL